MEEILNRVYWGNTVMAYLAAAGGILLTWVIVKLVKKKLWGLLKRLTSKTNTISDDLLIDAGEKFIVPYIYLFVNYHILMQLNLADNVRNIAGYALAFITTYYAVRLINFIIHGSMLLYMERKGEPAERIKQVNGILIIVKVMTWGIGLLMLINNLGFDITALIAGFGVGGIAIALAAQNILGDLFSYFVIFFDKPFEIGDFIIVGDSVGTVEKIGIKTSHVRSPDGQQLVMPNAEMVKSVIHNYKRLQRRRVVFSIGVVYYTTAEKLRNIPAMIETIITQADDATFDRAHFKSFGDFSMNYEIAYYIESADFKTYMNTHHGVCLDIFEKFEEAGIEFAFPTQTLFLNNQNSQAEASKEENKRVALNGN